MKILISILVIILSMFLFKKASGTLKINLINIAGFSFYSIMIFEFIGVTLVYLGFRDHYLIKKISSDFIINKTYWMATFVMLLLPLVIMISNKFIYKINNMNDSYISKLKNNVVLEDNKKRDRLFLLIIILFVFCLISIVYMFKCIGYIPLFKYFDNSFNYATERIRISRNFSGNQYIKNLIGLTITPLLSYLAYVYMRVTKEKKWLYLFILLFIANVFVKTSDFSKAPFVYYILYFFIIEVLLGKTFSFKKIIPFMLSGVILIIFSYNVIGGYNGKLISLSNGPLSRLMITQAGTLFLHVDAFPRRINYLMGHSFPKFTKIFFGKGDYYIRSGRAVMELYSKDAVKNGTAGVMSTMFLGEAYANFGIIGMIISPIIVGFIISSVLCLYLKSKKSPLNIILYVECFIIFSTVLQAGFMDFIYNIQFVEVILIIFLFKFCLSEKFDNLINNILVKKKGEEHD